MRTDSLNDDRTHRLEMRMIALETRILDVTWKAESAWKAEEERSRASLAFWYNGLRVLAVIQILVTLAIVSGYRP